MLFNSLVFITLFLPMVCLTYGICCRYVSPLIAHGVLVAASLAFYASWGGYLYLLLISLLGNFLLGDRMQRSTMGRARDAWLAVGIVGNMVVLAYYKYANFVAIQFGFDAVRPDSLPLGISFFTFQQIAFLVFLHRHAERRTPFASYATAVSFFPHLVSGPLLKYESIMDQIAGTPAKVGGGAIFMGLALFIFGLSKKLLIADPLGPYVASVFDAPANAVLGGGDVWLAAVAYSLQLYFDFSGYSDMALGLGYLFGLQLPENFRSPYRATNISQFWRRWHITLSTFLRDLLYIPLGGNRNGMARQMFALCATMLLGGLWHGAGWTFLVWGAWHGIFLLAWHLTARLRAAVHIGTATAWLATMVVVASGWIWFRAANVGVALKLFAAMLEQPVRLAQPVAPETLWLLVVGTVIVLGLPTSYALAWRLREHVQRGLSVVVPVLLGLWFAFIISHIGGVTEFLYANF